MPIKDCITALCLSPQGGVLVTAEHLTPDGLDPELAHALVASGRVSAQQLDGLAAGFALYFTRCRDLFRRAPLAWFAPRQLNVLIITDTRSISPHAEPITGTSLSLYASDLELHPEYIAFQIAFAERLSLLHSVRASVGYSLSWFLDRTDGECDAFARAAREAARPDARAYVQIADALPWIRSLWHDPLRVPTVALTEPHFGIEGANLFLPTRLQATFMALCEQVESIVHKAIAAFNARAVPVFGADRAPLDALCDWLQTSQPRLAIRDGETTVWSRREASTTALRSALARSPEAVVAGLHETLSIIAARTERFWSVLGDPDLLPRQYGELKFSVGTVIDPAQREIVYTFTQAGFDARYAAAPPIHRLMVGACTIHEWGHLAHAARLVRVPDARKAEYLRQRTALGELFAAVLTRAPAPLQAEIAHELAPLVQQAGSLPAFLARKTLARVGDYLCNCLMAELADPAETQAYARVNVRHHADERLDFLSELARYAYEVHYLSLAGMARDYFYRSSRFVEHFIEPGVISQVDAEALFDAVGAVLDCYEFDKSRLDVRPPAQLRAAA